MKLSEAIMLGRHLVDRSAAADVSVCAIGMAARATGYIPLDRRDVQAYIHLQRKWPWLRGPKHLSPCGCMEAGDALDHIWHVFDEHIIHGRNPWTLEQLCDWIATVEPAEDADAVRVLGERDHADRGSGPDSSEARAELLRVGAEGTRP